jgi:hypothetical protein
MIGTRYGKAWWSSNVMWSVYRDVELEQGATSDAQGKGIM